MRRRQLAGLGLLACGLARPGFAQTEKFPSRPIRWVLPYAPGGPADAFSRAVGRG
ncbi:hypothetical protein ACFQU7_32440 [Pseudoroseomonas wenyumeiae]